MAAELCLRQMAIGAPNYLKSDIEDPYINFLVFLHRGAVEGCAFCPAMIESVEASVRCVSTHAGCFQLDGSAAAVGPEGLARMEQMY